VTFEVAWVLMPYRTTRRHTSQGSSSSTTFWKVKMRNYKLLRNTAMTTAPT